MARGAFSVFNSFVCKDKYAFNRSMSTKSLVCPPYTIQVGSVVTCVRAPSFVLVECVNQPSESLGLIYKHLETQALATCIRDDTVEFNGQPVHMMSPEYELGVKPTGEFEIEVGDKVLVRFERRSVIKRHGPCTWEVGLSRNEIRVRGGASRWLFAAERSNITTVRSSSRK